MPAELFGTHCPAQQQLVDPEDCAENTFVGEPRPWPVACGSQVKANLFSHSRATSAILGRTLTGNSVSSVGICTRMRHGEIQ